MDSFEHLPDKVIIDKGELSRKFLELEITSFREACMYVHNLDYGYNSDKDSKMILFIEKRGSCTTKHGVIAGLAEEIDIPLYKKVGVYKFIEEIVEGAGKILEKYDLPYVPMVHCFLVFENYRFDLTEGNFNGKKTSIEDFIYDEKVTPFISRKDEYKLYRKIVDEKVLTSKEMEETDKTTILKAREEAIILLKDNIK